MWQPERFKAELKRWSRKVSTRCFIIPRKLPWDESKEIFKSAYKRGNLHPKVWTGEDWNDGSSKTVQLGATWEQGLRAALLGRLTDSEIMNRYLPALWFDFYALQERDQKEKVLWSIQDYLDDLTAQQMHNEEVSHVRN